MSSTSRRGRWALGLAMAMAVMASSAAATQELSKSKEPAAHFTLRVKPGDATTVQGFFHFYNMQYRRAAASFEESLKSHPQDPYAVNHLLEAVLFHELHREGKLDAQLYLSNEFVHFQTVPPDPKVLERIKQLRERAAELESKQLDANPNDADALYAQSVTRGLEATEQALIKKAWFAALRSGLAAYDDSKRVLELRPGDSDAKLIVGIYNYVVGSLPWPVKLAALLATIHGSKTKGLELMREAAAGDGEASIDAKTTLALFLAREHQYGESLNLIDWLYRTFPDNFLFGLSRASLLNSAGKTQESIAAYRRLVELGKQGQFPDQKVELAAVNLGDGLRGEKRWSEAAEAYDQAAAFPEADPQIVAGAELAAGKMYDRQGKRAEAIASYRKVLKMTNDEDLVRQARAGLAKPYKGN